MRLPRAAVTAITGAMISAFRPLPLPAAPAGAARMRKSWRMPGWRWRRG